MKLEFLIKRKDGVSVDSLLKEIAENIGSKNYIFKGDYSGTFYYFGFEDSDLHICLIPGEDWEGRNLVGGITEEEMREKFSRASKSYRLAVVQGSINPEAIKAISQRVRGTTYLSRR